MTVRILLLEESRQHYYTQLFAAVCRLAPGLVHVLGRGAFVAAALSRSDVDFNLICNINRRDRG
jgi:hypothetical protein